MAFCLILISVLLAMLYQTVIATIKWKNMPTGTNVDYKSIKSEVNLSMTLCQTSSNNSFNNVYYKEKKETPWIPHMSEKVPFQWQRSRFELYSCVTIPFIGASMKINHQRNKLMKDSFYLHDSGFLNGKSTLKIGSSLLQHIHFVQLHVKQIRLVEDESLCTNKVDFDSCRNNHIDHEMNATFGCVLFSR